jgi:glycerol-3-phosphate dehydrogenase
LLSVFGGKITTARHLAEEALGKLGHLSTASRDARFPGGDMHDFETFLVELRRGYPFLGKEQSLRLARAYGTMVYDMIGNADNMGEDFGGGLTAREVDWLTGHEWARTVEDVIWRRSKTGLAMNDVQKARVAAYLEGK